MIIRIRGVTILIISTMIAVSQSILPFSINYTARKRAFSVLSKNRVIDGHNDFPMGVRDVLNSQLQRLHFDQDLIKDRAWTSYLPNHTDIPRLRKGMVGGQFWSAYVDCNAQFKDATQKFFEQIDLIHQIISKYPDDLMWAQSSADIERAFRQGKIASLIGIESGHAIRSSLPILRSLYAMGARYMTLTHVCDTPWAGAATEGAGTGLSHFGRDVVREMNRLGMLVDLSHVSTEVMRDALMVTMSPVIFSHSSARNITNHPRNVPDDVLKLVKKNGGIVMVNFYACHIVDDCARQEATVQNVVAHINHVRKVAGVDHVGIGGDFNGVDKMLKDIPDVSHYPHVFEALILSEVNWTNEDLGKLASGNIIRVLKQVENIRDKMSQLNIKPLNRWLTPAQLKSWAEETSSLKTPGLCSVPWRGYVK